MVRLRALLVSLLILALPVQGSLAASMRSCMSGQAAVKISDSVLEANHHSAHHHAASRMATDAHAVDDGLGISVAAVQDLPAGQHKCDICEACGHATALSSRGSAFAPSAGIQSHPTTLPVRVDTRGLPVPDKPPRS